MISLFAALHAVLYAILTASEPVDFHSRSSLRLVCLASTALVDSQRLSGFLFGTRTVWYWCEFIEYARDIHLDLDGIVLNGCGRSLVD